MANAASSTSVQSTFTQSTPTRTREQALIGAHNAAGLAQAYLEKGSYHAAKRKIISALRDIELLTKESEVAA